MNLHNSIRSMLTLFAALALIQSASAQVGSETDHWDWTPSAKHHESIVKVATEFGSGTGVLVHVFESRPVAKGFEGLCLTANHVIADDNGKQKIKVVYQNGKRAKDCKVISVDEELDIALLWVWVPESVNAATIAPVEVAVGESLEFCGLGGGSTLDLIRHFNSESESPTNSKMIFASVPLLSGDSGGPIFNSNSQLVGIISGGWFWFDGGVKSRNGHNISVTWPARACNRDRLAELVANAVSDSTGLVQK